METIRRNIRTPTYWLYMALIGFMVFIICYHGQKIAVKMFVPVAFVVIFSNVTGFSKSLVFAVIASSILSITVIDISMFSEYSFRYDLADIIIWLQVLLLIIYRTNNPQSLRTKDVFAWPMIIFCIGAIISVFVAFNKTASIAFLLLLVTGYLFYRYILLVFQNKEDLKLLIGIFVAALALTIIWAFINKSAVPESATKVGIHLESRAGYVFAGPNGLAAVLVLLIPFTFIAFSTRSVVVKIFLAGLFVAGFYLLSVTYSRNGYISFIISLLVMIVIFTRVKSVSVYLIAAVIAIPVVLLGMSMLSRLFTVTMFQVDPSALFRLIMWRSAINEFMKHPLTGIGLGNFYYVTKLLHSGFCHNLYLSLFAETGILGGGSVLCLMGVVFYKLFTSLRRTKEGFMKNVNICLIGSWVAFFINNMFDQFWFFLDRTSEMKFFWLLIATTAVFINHVHKKRGLETSA